jgi:hypothetical protein
LIESGCELRRGDEEVVVKRRVLTSHKQMPSTKMDPTVVLVDDSVLAFDDMSGGRKSLLFRQLN